MTRERDTICQHLGCGRKTWRDDARCDRHPIADGVLSAQPLGEQAGGRFPVAQQEVPTRASCESFVPPVTCPPFALQPGDGRDLVWLAKVRRGVALMAQWDAEDRAAERGGAA